MENKYLKLYGSHDAMMLQDADTAITTCGLWDWMSTYNPTVGEGFMFSNHPNLDKISEVMTYQGHSGSSFAWTMRTMQQVARLGWETFAEVVSTNNPPCPCRRRSGQWAGWCGVAGGGVPACEH